MTAQLHDFIFASAKTSPGKPAVLFRQAEVPYDELADGVLRAAQGFLGLGIQPDERIAVYLPKQPETVTAFFAATLSGAAFVPVNPLLKPEQVGYILRDCNVRILVTSVARAQTLCETLGQCHDLNHLVVIDSNDPELPDIPGATACSWESLLATSGNRQLPRRIDADLAAILYTSGSTGRPKGVVLSHRNMVTGAESVAGYLENRADDRLLAVLPFSFDYGLSQLTTAFSVAASVVLMDYLLPQDVIRAVAGYHITGLAAVPPLWVQIANRDWPVEAQESLRYITNSGGAMPRAVLDALRKALPKTRPYLMYGLTEAFRSTYLPPEEIDRRPDSMGRAIPNAEIMVVREDGTPCQPGEPGELVHRGSLVAMGYWNDRERTAERFRPAPARLSGVPIPEIAVWSGDTVRWDEDGFLYFIGRKDDMIKTSGYRVSPTEVEEVLYGSGKVGHASALGIPHPVLGQAVVIVVSPAADETVDTDELMLYCKQKLPAFMVPAYIHVQKGLPRNPNGKIDRKRLAEQLQGLFQENGT